MQRTTDIIFREKLTLTINNKCVCWNVMAINLQQNLPLMRGFLSAHSEEAEADTDSAMVSSARRSGASEQFHTWSYRQLFTNYSHVWQLSSRGASLQHNSNSARQCEPIHCTLRIVVLEEGFHEDPKVEQADIKVLCWDICSLSKNSLVWSLSNSYWLKTYKIF